MADLSLKERILEEHLYNNGLLPGSKLPTIKELAKEYGVSGPTIGTTIAILANEGWVTKRRGSGIYTTNKCRMVNKEGTGLKLRIGCIVPNMTLELCHRVIEGVDLMVRHQEATLEIANSIGKESEEKKQVASMHARGVNGVILYTTPCRREEYLGTEFRDFPIVVVDLYENQMKRPHVTFDNRLAGREMTQYLWAKGCRRIAYGKFENPGYYHSIEERFLGYRQALRELDPSASSEFVFSCGYLNMETWDSFFEQMEKLLAVSPSPDGVILPTDEYVCQAKMVLQARGISIPEEILIAGFDNLRVHHMENNWPTTNPDFVRMGEMATEMLFECIKTHNHLEPWKIVLPCPLLVPDASSIRRVKYGSRYSDNPLSGTPAGAQLVIPGK